MDISIKDHLFIVGGASSGLGFAIASALLEQGAHVIGIARNTDTLSVLQNTHPDLLETIAGDITKRPTLEKIISAIGERQLHGAVFNAGGPPAKTVLETSLEDWDNAYQSILRWKVDLTQLLVPLMKPRQYGRLLYLESSSVKQPIENLVLSNSLRLAVVGFVKTLSQEIADSGITLNVLGTGSHDTAAIERLYKKKAEQTGLTEAETRERAIKQIPVGRLGKPADFAALASWLLSPGAGYITGQTISVDGGMIKSVFG